MKPRHRIQDLLKLNGFTLHRQKKHKVYKDHLGITFVMSKTPSDGFAEFNQIRNLRKIVTASGREFITD